MTDYTPFVLLGPGDSIREELQFHGWDRRTLAAELGLSHGEAVRLLHNRLPVTRALASRLGNAFGQSPEFWVNLDAQYRTRLAERNTAGDRADRRSPAPTGPRHRSPGQAQRRPGERKHKTNPA